MIPVRRLVRSKRLNSGCSSWRDVHRRHAVDRRAALGVDGRQGGPGVERWRRHHDRRAVDAADQGPQHAAEAMVERHRHADAILGRVTQPLARVIGVHEHVAMREHRALGQAGRPRGELDVVDVGRALAAACAGSQLGLRRLIAGFQVGPGPPARTGPAVQRDQSLQAGELRARPVSRRRRGHFGAERLDHRHEVRPLERRADDRAWIRRPSSARRSARGPGRPGSRSPARRRSGRRRTASRPTRARSSTRCRRARRRSTPMRMSDAAMRSTRSFSSRQDQRKPSAGKTRASRSGSVPAVRSRTLPTVSSATQGSGVPASRAMIGPPLS